LLLTAFVPAFAPPTRAQDTTKAPETAKAPEPPVHYYHFEFVIQEVGADGKPTNSRSYSTIVCTDRNEQFGAVRTGLRVPIITGARPGATGNDDLEIQYQYLDVGVNIDTRNVHEIGRQLAVQLKAEVSSLADSAPSFVSKLPNDPVIRQNMWQASVIIPVGKPTVVFSSDAFDSKAACNWW
jgi:hypothetical protein